jgi:peptide/nickel transport system permease protein
MRRYLLKRLAAVIPTLFAITLITFGLVRLAPGDPLALGSEAITPGLSEALAQQVRERRGLDRPLWEQYARWVGRIGRLDFGESFQDGRPVWARIEESLPITALLSGLALLLSFALAVPLGVVSAAKRDTALDRGITIGLFLLYSLPSFWVAVSLLLLFSGGRVVSWFPMQGLVSPGYASLSPLAKVGDVGWHLVLPVGCLSYGALASISRYARSGMLEALSQDYVRTARAKGLSERAVVWRHALRNAALPILTLLGLMVPGVLGGSVVVEQIFGIHGMGLLAFEALSHRDYPTVMGVTTLAALLTMAASLLADLGYAVADPRIRLEASR